MHWEIEAKTVAHTRYRRWTEIAANFTGLMVTLWVLYPVFFHAFVWRSAPSPRVIAELRVSPDDAVLAALAAERVIGTPPPEDRAALSLADRWLAASRDPGAVGQHPLITHLSATDLVQNAGIGALPFSSLFAADVNLRAFHANGNVLYLATARDLILGYVRYERQAWVDRGFLWNDHAITARIGVIASFWASYRSHPLFDSKDAQEILQHVSRSVALLSAPSHFTAWSNHGVMQNIALLQAAAVFPALVDTVAVRRLAIERLTMQLRYYVSDEGVVLEHSAGYHLEGVSLLAQAVKLAEMNGLPVPPEWRKKLRLAQSFLDRLTRPDGTLPAHGDTRTQLPSAPDRLASRQSAHSQSELAIYALSGYAVWWATDEAGRVSSHSLAAWSHFPGHAHKHADESELAVWADGRGWITPSGYARYDSEFRALIEGWRGSNAPHGDAEIADPRRRSELLGSASSALAVLLDIRRDAADGAGFRRQVFSIANGRWLVIDLPIGSLRWPSIETLWTFYPDLVAEPQSDGRFKLRSAQGQTMGVTLASGGGARAQANLHVGSRNPFAGWVATERGMLPAPALRVVAAPTGWTAAYFDASAAADTIVLQLDDGEHWRAASEGWHVRRDGDRVELSVGDRQEILRVVAPADTKDARAAIEGSLATAVNAYPKYRSTDEYRFRVAKILCGLWLVQVVLYLLARPALARRGWSTTSHAVIVLPWAAIAAWLGAVYFAR